MCEAIAARRYCRVGRVLCVVFKRLRRVEIEICSRDRIHEVDAGKSNKSVSASQGSRSTCEVRCFSCKSSLVTYRIARIVAGGALEDASI